MYLTLLIGLGGMINNYKRYLTELKLTQKKDVDKTPLADAIEYAQTIFKDVYSVIPKFDSNYTVLIKEVMYGRYKRNQMPVIASDDYDAFQEYLSSKGIKSKIIRKVIDDLKPSQRQIYLAQILGNIKKNGLSNSLNWITKKSLFIVSKDNYIIDGHHRFATGILIDPKMRVRALVVDLPQTELLKVALHFSDKIAKNTRNEGLSIRTY